MQQEKERPSLLHNAVDQNSTSPTRCSLKLVPRSGSSCRYIPFSNFVKRTSVSLSANSINMHIHICLFSLLFPNFLCSSISSHTCFASQDLSCRNLNEGVYFHLFLLSKFLSLHHIQLVQTVSIDCLKFQTLNGPFVV